MRDGMHDWVDANNRMAKVLKDNGYHYQYVYCLNTGHGIRPRQAADSAAGAGMAVAGVSHCEVRSSPCLEGLSAWSAVRCRMSRACAAVREHKKPRISYEMRGDV